MNKKLKYFLKEVESAVEYELDPKILSLTNNPRTTKVQKWKPWLSHALVSGTCCFVCVGITLGILIPKIKASHASEDSGFTCPISEIMAATFDRYSVVPFAKITIHQNQMKLLPGVKNNQKYVMYFDSLESARSMLPFHFAFSYSDKMFEFSDEYNYFEVPDVDFDLKVDIFMDTELLISSDIYIDYSLITL